MEEDVYFFEGAVGCFGVEEVDCGDDDEVCAGEDYVGPVAYGVERYGGDDYDPGRGVN